METHISSLTQSAKDFFTWWGEGLALLIPGQNKKFSVRGKHSLLLKFGREEYQVINEKEETLLKGNCFDNTNVTEQILQLFKSESYKDTGLALNIQLSSSEVIIKRISLPANTEDNLNDVIQYEMDRYTPFNKDDVYFDYRIEKRISDKQLIKVLLVVVKKEILTPVVKALKNSDVHLQNISVINQNDPSQNLNDVHLLKAHEDINKDKSFSNKWLMLAAAVLLLLTGFTPIIINYIHIYKLSSELQGLEQTVQKVKQLQSEYAKMQDQVGYLVAIRENNPSIIELLNLLTDTIPDHTFVQRLSLESSQLSIQGLSASASELIPILDQSGVFDDIRFAAPVTQSGGEGLERYSITAQLKILSNSHKNSE